MALVERLDNMTTADFARGGERRERELARALLREVEGATVGGSKVNGDDEEGGGVMDGQNDHDIGTRLGDLLIEVAKGQAEVTRKLDLPYPWCIGAPTKEDCHRRGYCARRPTCGD